MESFKEEDLGDRPDDWNGERGYKPIGGLKARDLYDTDLQDTDRGQVGRRRHFSQDELLGGDWLFTVDNDLPLALASNTGLWDQIRQLPASTKICPEWARQVSNSFSTAKEEYGFDGIDEIEILRDCSVLKLDENSQPFLVILADPDSKTPSSKTQIGLPILPAAGSQNHFSIMREWLHACDHTHQNVGCHLDQTSLLPTRVIDVGGDLNSVRLYCSTYNEEESYVALSHYWGSFTGDQRISFCTFTRNLADRAERIDMSTLPKTFRDAIRVTRELGQRYIWIDSLCIIQDDLDDWRREASTMERVYSMAYFTIAATSAADSSQGFLNPRKQRDFVKIEKPPSPPPSPPTPFNRRDPFAGIRESLIYRPSSESHILGDHQFPASADQRIHSQKLDFLQSISAKYMKRAFTQPSDRAIAYAGLEKRLAKAFTSASHYGIIDRFLHRGLLWLRKTDRTLTRTIPGYGVFQQNITLSWSWLAYEGDIEPLSIGFESVAWSKSLHFQNGKGLQCVVREFENCDIVREGDEYAVFSNDCNEEESEGSNGTESDSEVSDDDSYKPAPHRSWLRFDVDASDIGLLKCVVVGRKVDSHMSGFQEDCYIIVLKRNGCDRMFAKANPNPPNMKFTSVILSLVGFSAVTTATPLHQLTPKDLPYPLSSSPLEGPVGSLEEWNKSQQKRASTTVEKRNKVIPQLCLQNIGQKWDFANHFCARLAHDDLLRNPNGVAHVDARSCQKIACFGNPGVGIFLCNDNAYAIAPRIGYLAEYADTIIEKCNWHEKKHNVDLTSGQMFDRDNYNVVVRGGEKCEGFFDTIPCPNNVDYGQ
ncbi:hypothetical protein GLAREA_08652 [Glarea lozoyensis ATCC 20868]|uniref:Heterokaryon incompatibility domain-containing protein n=1 Tax=Glarea lozoyensis (strain ATCC 20868 / MF5171) TaxID=1116229 RepID=S3DH57_GLAL2|nr:uncharacterized protein GLAREA_08652 [Glarea lozoyensis ATCC 20868]EPE36489.1 hypothetical protein GLAREA_08652 [Glarea lozoyensis ATCC 20868]